VNSTVIDEFSNVKLPVEVSNREKFMKKIAVMGHLQTSQFTDDTNFSITQGHEWRSFALTAVL
jgi:hypothetical protein